MKFNIVIFCLSFFLLTVLPANVDAQAYPTLTRGDIPTIINNMNIERQERGLNSLKVDATLSKVAQSRSQFLAEEGRIYHISAPAGTPWPNLSQAGYSYTLAGENLAMGIENTEVLSDRWMASPKHMENILEGSYEDVGVGVTSGYYNGSPASYVVVYFGKKSPTSASRQNSTIYRPVKIANYLTVPNGKTAQSVGTTQSTVVASDIPDALLTPSASSKEAQEIRIMRQLIAHLQSYLKIVSADSELI